MWRALSAFSARYRRQGRVATPGSPSRDRSHDRPFPQGQDRADRRWRQEPGRPDRPRLRRQGAKAIVIHYNSAATQADAEATVAAVQAAGSKAVALQGDLTSAAAMERLFADAVAAVGRPDIAINTVGKVLKKPLLEISEAEYDEMSAVNAKAAFFFLKEAGRHVNDGGRICTLVTSLLGAFTPFYSSYAGTKAPVEHFTRAASKEFGERGISVTAIGPVRWTRRSSTRPRVPMRRRTTRPRRRCRRSPAPA
jgi:NAD(P)-dependent dehydrogenase (short-subunit alcohol dehydrogenase family)